MIFPYIRCEFPTFLTLVAPFPVLGALWLITGWIIAATAMLLLDDRHLLFALFAVLLFLGVLTPTWKYFLQQHKMFLRGPWDIPTASSMQLDIPTYPSLNFT